ncbi:hypothetical protein MLD63_12295 [Paracoccus sp. TK19116]|uniref:Uncharacterized protein n=1 Tax=Paracoccus albicereus TaxID=2922394 RepID=A0ABT1MSC4_9RHOB|nr:protealysin inhibitor emfourin [Paracoccus albicereus]MCQ0971202.1 hypothetical protein [Paracoccus albicereus]
MIIEISSSGGFGGIAVPAMNTRIDVDRQSASMQKEICEYFEPQDLDRLARAKAPARGADMMTYEIRVIDRQSGQHVYRLREDQIPPEMLDLLDSLRDG